MTVKPRSKAICVLGAHRSGTSTITRSLNLLGAYLGADEDLMEPLPENPEGFWERLDIFYLQDRLLKVLKRDWGSTAPLPGNWHKRDEIGPFKDELVELVKKEFLGRPLWLWKDPRTCLLLPLWKDVLAGLGADLKIVFVVRNPLDVARSLEKRDGFSRDKGLGIWFNYTLNGLKAIEGLETVFISYDDFLNDWESELKKCADGLGIGWPADDVAVRGQMASFVKHDLRHSVSGLDELHAAEVPAPVIRLYAYLLELLSQAGEAPSEAAITEMHGEFVHYARMFDSDIAALADCRSEVAEIQAAQAGMQSELEARTALVRRLEDELKAGEERIALLQKELMEKTYLAEDLRKTVGEIVNSASWKITNPLRVVHQMLRPRKDA